MNNHENLYVSFEPASSAVETAIEKIALVCSVDDHAAYLIHSPLGGNFEDYEYTESFVWSSPKRGLTFVNCGDDTDAFKNYVEDFIEDLGALAAKHNYRGVVGRPRDWKSLIRRISSNDINGDEWLDLQEDIRSSELLTSLVIGSINNVDRVGKSVPTNIVDAVKRKVILLDGDQTRFIFNEPNSKIIRIQGLSGTGKTELLLHRLKEIYINKKGSRIALTCHSKILANELRQRIPVFFNFMKVEEQIDWDSRLMCTNSWGSASEDRSGIYRHICSCYNIPFLNLRDAKFDFSIACKSALDLIKSQQLDNFSYTFDYIFIDESQDFPKEFLELCELVTSKVVYSAGDIFQNIFDKYNNEEKVDYLLKKCYRTDPSTLTIAHALSMGLFEKPIIRWLNDKQWEACGYDITREKSNLIISRSPIRRFSDLPDLELESPLVLHNYSGYEFTQMADGLTQIIKDILRKHPSSKIDDICILCPLDTKPFYNLADHLSYRLQSSLGHQVNKSYESKKRIKGKLFFSNRNNVKGLEFPFVICLAFGMKRSIDYRNTLYMMLTRSLISTHLILFGDPENVLCGKLDEAIKIYSSDGSLRITEPSKKEQSIANEKLLSDSDNLSHFDFVSGVVKSMRLDIQDRKGIIDTVCKFRPNIFEQEIIEDFITTLITSE